MRTPERSLVVEPERPEPKLRAWRLAVLAGCGVLPDHRIRVVVGFRTPTGLEAAATEAALVGVQRCCLPVQ